MAAASSESADIDALLKRNDPDAASPGDLVSDCIYLGGEKAALDPAWLKEHGITLVINCAPTDVKRAVFSGEGPAPDYLELPLEDFDTVDLTSAITTSTKAITDHLAASKGSVLVHCRQGVSRSASCLIAYYMNTRSISTVDAWCLVKAARPVAYPNFGFLTQLLALEKKKMGTISIPRPKLNLHYIYAWQFDSDAEADAFLSGRLGREYVKPAAS